MAKPISDYTTDELSAKIEAIKAERERTANALKKYEEELERRKQEVPLGVPTEGNYCVLADGQVNYRRNQGNFERKIMMEVFNIFPSFESALKNSEMLIEWRKTLVANSKGEPIDIQALLPLLKKGKLCYSPELGWAWCSNDGKITCGKDQWYSTGENWLLNAFNLKPAENWEDSLMECGL